VHRVGLALRRVALEHDPKHLLDFVEVAGNKVPHPVMMFLYLIIGVIVLSAVLAVRLATLCKGHSGVSYGLLQQLERLLGNDILPAIPEEGSVGASGDLTPLSYLAAVLCGEREVLTKARLAEIKSRQQAALPPQAPAAGDAGGSEASPPRAPLPPPLIVQYRGQFGDNHVVGRFERLDANRWLETNRESNPGRDNVLSFEDKGRKGGVIEMFDDTRAMWIRIDLNTRRIFWSTNGITSMLASVLGMALSIQFGIAMTYALGACFYVVCGILLVTSRSLNTIVMAATKPAVTPGLIPQDETAA